MSKASPFIYVLALPLLISLCFAQGGPDPLLTTISKDPDLTVFYSLFNATGGTFGIPGPDLEERFNFPKIGPFTAFAPTNDAFAQVSEPIVKLITAAPSYQLILAILRTHIAQGSFQAADLNNGSADVTAIEGFPLAFRLEDSGTTINGQAVLSPDEPLKAANGLVYKINRVIDPFIGYFGEDKETPSPQIDFAAATKKQSGSFDTNCSGSMASILLSDTQLSTLASALQTVDPAFVQVLSLNGLGDSPIFFAPSNDAFRKAGVSGSGGSANLAELPTSYYKTVQPSNADFSGFLLRFGVVPEGIEYGKGVSMSGFQVAVKDGLVNNAAVEDVVCGCNGCVARVSRWIDPIHRIFER